MNIKPARALAGTATVAVIGIATFIYAASNKAPSTAPSHPAPAKPTLVAKVDDKSGFYEEARSDLASVIMRRFFDRKDPDFGYDRIVRDNARYHSGPTAPMTKAYDVQKWQKIYDAHKGEKGFVGQDYQWHPGDHRDIFAAENSAEKEVLAKLADGPQTVIYTAGLFDKDGISQRIKGPAHLDYKGENAPTIMTAETQEEAKTNQDWLQMVAKQLLSKDSYESKGWKFSKHEVFADGKDCLNCHNHGEQTYDFGGKPKKIGAKDPIGMVMIASRTSPQVP